MDAFEYASPTSVKDAVSLLGSDWPQAAILAGGTDLLSLLKDDVEDAKRLVSIKKVSGLHAIENAEGGLRIGALVTLEQLISAGDVRHEFPSITEAVEGVTSPQIRNMGTVGGDLCQRPRCWYYRAGFGLLALDKDGNSLPAHGDNRYHAIFGNDGKAKFVSPSSLGPALVALGAKVSIAGPSGAREIPVEEFFVIPQKEGEREHALAPNEIVTAVTIPAASRGLRNGTYEVRHKQALDWPFATASVALRMRGERVESARVVLGQVAPKPWPAADVEKWLAGKIIDEANAAKAGDAAAEGAMPMSRNGYKVQLVRVAVKRALLAAAARKA
jgi:xanthine dehydrogenase YagS FAD-binding subunit